MRGVRISGLELDSDGSVAVEKLADIFEDGEVTGDSYLASSLRKSVAERGPTPLDTIIRRFNNGYFGASWMYKGRVYIKEDSEAPGGARVRTGPRGGKYYETKAGRGRPLKEAPEDWVPKVGDRIRFRWPGDKYNGRLGKVKELHGPNEDGRTFAVIDGIGWRGGAYFDLSEGKIVPAPYTAKEKREMKVKDILVQEFGKVTRRYDSYEESGISMEVMDSHTQLGYDVFDTEAGVELWVKAEPPGEKKRYQVTKESAVSMEAFMKALPEMNTEALQSMKDEVSTIIFSPVGNPKDRKLSQATGQMFTSNATMNMPFRIMHIYPSSKDIPAKNLANILTHETGHAVDSARGMLVTKYNDKLSAFWKTQEHMPASSEAMRKIEEEHGIPPHPNAWMEPYSNWLAWNIAQEKPDHVHYWGYVESPHAKGERTFVGEKFWREIPLEVRHVITEKASKARAVTNYAKTNEKEYYAEAYMYYQVGMLDKDHVMYEHFRQLPEIEQWTRYGRNYAAEEEVPWPAD